MLRTLRGKLKQTGINIRSFCNSHKRARHLPVTIKVLFRQFAPHYDDLEIELHHDGWLLADESLYEILMAGDVLRLRENKMSTYTATIDCLDYFPQSPEDVISLAEHAAIQHSL